MTAQGQISRRPYLLRAMHEWISDSGQTPHIVVDASIEGVDVPRRYVRDDRIVLNVSLSATSGLSLGNDRVCFRARFGGVSCDVSVPIAAVLGVYARETGQGLLFSDGDLEPPPDRPSGGGEESRRPHLKVVK